MNNSKRTKIVAEGMSLLAAYMDMPGDKLAGSPVEHMYEMWAARHPEYVDYVNQAHTRLFDDLNSKF